MIRFCGRIIVPVFDLMRAGGGIWRQEFQGQPNETAKCYKYTANAPL